MSDRPDETSCPEKPEKLLGQPIGQYHCPGCGAMVVGGMEHPTDADVLYQGIVPYCLRHYLVAAKKQARAEVLASCIAELKKLESEATRNEAYGIRKACQTLAYVFRQLQPAAADLEEHDKQIQLELLASFLRRIDLSLIEGYAATTTPAYNEALTDLRDGYMKDFKPVGKDLEELLREAREKGWDMGIVMAQNKLAYMLCLLPNEARPARKQLVAAIGVVKALRKEKARAEGKG